MENTSKQTDEPVLLRWEMPAARRKLIAGFFWLLLAGLLLSLAAFAVYAVLSVTSGDPYLDRVLPLSAALNLAMLLAWVLFILPVFAGAYGIKCTNAGVTLSMFVTGRRSLRCDEISVLRQGRLGHTILRYGDRGRSYAYLNIPPDVRDRLIAILRETSDARIIGFDSEAS